MEVGEEIGLAYMLLGLLQCAFTNVLLSYRLSFLQHVADEIRLVPTCFVGVLAACTHQACLWHLTSKLGLLQVEPPGSDLPLHGILPRTSLTAQLALKKAAQLQDALEADVRSQDAPSTALVAVRVSFGNRAVYCAHVEDGPSGAGSLQSLQAGENLAAQVTIQALFLCCMPLCLAC